jgi:hypothetical protein
MLPILKIAIQRVIDEYYKPAKKDWDSHAFNKKPAEHIFKSLEILKNSITLNRKVPKYSLYCSGEHEISFLLNTMNDLMDSLSLSPEQMQWTVDLHNKITVFCLKDHPRTKLQIELKNELDRNKALSITLNDGKQMILARIRNMLLTQNI